MNTNLIIHLPKPPVNKRYRSGRTCNNCILYHCRSDFKAGCWYHEIEPNLHACRWQSRDEHTVYLWYREEPYIVSWHVVSVLRKLPKPTFAQRCDAFLSDFTNRFLAVTFIVVTILFILNQIFG